MATQIIVTDPNNDMFVIDNSAAPVFPTPNANTLLGYDTTVPGASAQATNPYANTGSTTLDSVNDTFYPNPHVATVSGNPVQNAQPTYAKVSTILNSLFTTRLLWKNPA